MACGKFHLQNFSKGGGKGSANRVSRVMRKVTRVAYAFITLNLVCPAPSLRPKARACYFPRWDNEITQPR